MEFSEGLLKVLRDAKQMVVFTGAGVSAESGVPTFRDAQTGLWARYRAEELATPEAFLRNPGLVWRWYAWRREMVRGANPNAAHSAIAGLSSRVPTVTLVTQNVDGLHQRAGSRDVIELHGNIHRVKCFDRGHVAECWDDTAEEPPACQQCGSRLRPDVVWFNEILPADALREAESASRRCQVFLSIGTSMLVYPAANLPYAAAEAGAAVVQINPEPTQLDRVAAFTLRGKAGEILPALCAAAWA